MKKILLQRINGNKSLVNVPPWLKKIHKDESKLIDRLSELQAIKGEYSEYRRQLKREARETTSARKLTKIQKKIDQIDTVRGQLNYKSKRIKYYLETLIELDDFEISRVEDEREIKKLRPGVDTQKVKEIKTIMTFTKAKDFREWTPEILRTFTKENFEKMALKPKSEKQQAKENIEQIHHGRIIIGFKIDDDQVDESKNKKRKEAELRAKFNKDNAYLFNRIIKTTDKSRDNLAKVFKQERQKFIRSQRPKDSAHRKELSQKFDDRNKSLLENIVKSRSKKPDALKKTFLKTRKDFISKNYTPVKRSDSGVTYISTKRYDDAAQTTAEAIGAIERFKAKYIFSGIGLNINDVCFSETLSTTFHDEDYDFDEEDDYED